MRERCGGGRLQVQWTHLVDVVGALVRPYRLLVLAVRDARLHTQRMTMAMDMDRGGVRECVSAWGALVSCKKRFADMEHLGEGVDR